MMKQLCIAVIGMLPFVANAQQWELDGPVSRGSLSQSLRSENPLTRSMAITMAFDFLVGARRHRDLPAEAVADDLVALITSQAPATERADAVGALIRSGRRGGGPASFPGALAHLRRVHERSADMGVRLVTMEAIVKIAEPSVAFAFLVPFAEGKGLGGGVDQLAAIGLLASLRTDYAAGFLRKLAEGGQVTDPWSREALAQLKATGYVAPDLPKPPAPPPSDFGCLTSTGLTT